MPADHDAVMEPRTWLPDPSHYPEQMTPLSATVWFEAVGLGLHAAAEELKAPFGGFVTRTALGWGYEAELEPHWEPDQRLLEQSAFELPDRWESTHRPRNAAIVAELFSLRPELPAPVEAVALLDRMWELVLEQWTVHFLVVVPAQVAAEIFHRGYAEVAGREDALASYRLLQAPRSEDRLVRLARRAKELRVDHLIRDLTVEHALERLREVTSGRRWLAELGEYLDPVTGVGGRSRWHELSLPREAELPQLTLEAIRLYLEDEPAGAEPPEAVPESLAELRRACAPAFALKEEHTYHIDYPGLLATREVLLGFARRLAAEGALDAIDDVWMLERAELRRALTEELDLRGLVAARRAELARGLAEGPKPYLGDPPAAGERHVTQEKFYGRAGQALAGVGASPGVAEGTARVVSGGESFREIHRGDILVTTTTTPAWTPLFPALAALVTETGGILSHAAVVAREYGIAAVVGATGATTAIPDGARIRVDGTSGQVTLL
jgi:pyruvate,water dikinase